MVENYKLEHLKLSDLELNKGQMYGLPKNPRFIKDERFEALKKSIEDDPDMLELRELLVYPYEGKNIIIGGNMRYRACKELGYKELPCKILPTETPVAKLRAIVMKDNEAFGQTDWEALSSEWDLEEVKGWGVECDFLGNGEELPFEDNNETEGAKQKDLSDEITKEFKIEIDCENEQAQEELYNELTERGLVCRILTL